VCTTCPQACDPVNNIVVFNANPVDGVSCAIAACSPKSTIEVFPTVLRLPFTFSGKASMAQILRFPASERFGELGLAVQTRALLGVNSSGAPASLRLSLRSFAAMWGRDITAALYVNISDENATAVTQLLQWSSGEGAASSSSFVLSLADGDFSSHALVVRALSPPLPPLRSSRLESPLVRYAEVVLEVVAGDARLNVGGSGGDGGSLRIAVYLEPPAPQVASCLWTPVPRSPSVSAAPGVGMTVTAAQQYVPDLTYPSAPPLHVRTVRQRLHLPRGLGAVAPAVTEWDTPLAPFAIPAALSDGGQNASDTSFLAVRALARVDILVTALVGTRATATNVAFQERQGRRQNAMPVNRTAADTEKSGSSSDVKPCLVPPQTPTDMLELQHAHLCANVFTGHAAHRSLPEGSLWRGGVADPPGLPPQTRFRFRLSLYYDSKSPSSSSAGTGNSIDNTDLYDSWFPGYTDTPPPEPYSSNTSGAGSGLGGWTAQLPTNATHGTALWSQVVEASPIWLPSAPTEPLAWSGADFPLTLLLDPPLFLASNVARQLPPGFPPFVDPYEVDWYIEATWLDPATSVVTNSPAQVPALTLLTATLGAGEPAFPVSYGNAGIKSGPASVPVPWASVGLVYYPEYHTQAGQLGSEDGWTVDAGAAAPLAAHL
jgi:hypothetical protein